MKLKQQGIVLGTVALLFSAIAIPRTWLPPIDSPALAQDRPADLIDEVWQIVDREYVDGTFNHKDWKAIRNQYLQKKYQSKEEVYRSVRSMLKNLNDPYTVFFDPSEFRNFRVDISGQLVGVGIQLSQDEKTKKLIVIAPIENTSAARVGILAKDTIVKIDGKSTIGMNPDRASQLIRGRAGTSVKLTIQRENRQVLNFQLVRQQIEINPVEAKFRPKESGGIGYIRLKQFSPTAPTQMSAAIQKLETQGAKGYVLDLRSNPGGEFYGAIDIAKMWLNQGKIVSTVERQGTGETYSADGTAITNKPLVVLVDGGSASSSEVLAGALQDNHRAQLIGTKTFGKGLVQHLRRLAYGNGAAIKVTHYKYRTPSGKDINHAGIQPDVEVKLTQAQVRAFIQDRTKIATPADPQYAGALQTLQAKINNPNTPVANDRNTNLHKS